MNLQKCLVDECQLVTIDLFCAAHRHEEADECAACGEVVHDDGKGEMRQHGTIWAGAIDPPWYEWVCSKCLFLAEQREVDMAEARMDGGW